MRTTTLGGVLVLAAALSTASAQAAPKDTAAVRARERGIECLRAGDDKGAIQALDEAIGLDPSDPESYYLRGEAKQLQRDLKGAIADYSKAVDILPGYRQAFLNRGVAHAALGQLEQAVKDFTEAIKIEPDYPEAFFNRACTLSRLHREKEAIADCTEAIRLRKDYPQAFQARGLAKFRLNDLTGALADLKRAVQLRPGVALYHLNLGDTQTRRLDLEAAIAEYTRARDIGHGAKVAHALPLSKFLRAVALAGRGRAKALDGDREGGLVDLDRGADLEPKFAYIPLWIAGLGGGLDRLKPLAHGKKWISNVVRYALGETSAKDLLAAADTVEKGKKDHRAEHRCEASCYIALMEESRGEEAAALKHYKACVATGVTRYTEYHWAKARLAQLAAKH